MKTNNLNKAFLELKQSIVNIDIDNDELIRRKKQILGLDPQNEQEFLIAIENAKKFLCLLNYLSSECYMCL